MIGGSQRHPPLNSKMNIYNKVYTMRKTTKIYKDIPSGYLLCLHADCPMTDSCLRQLAYRRHAELGTFLRLINPSMCNKQADCPHYVSNQPVRFARGFVNFQKRMYPEQYDKFMLLLILHFGRSQYFKRRRGEIALPPEEQEAIQIALEKAGVTQKMEFDEYIDAINWTP